MSLDKLPTEMITKILSYLTRDTKGFIGLSSTSKRFNQASHHLHVVHSDVWARDRPLTYELSLHDYLFFDLNEDHVFDIVYALMYRLLNAKYRNFSTLRFENLTTREDYRAIIEALENSFRLNKESTGQKIRALVELELCDCSLSSNSLNRIISDLDNLSFLTMKDIELLNNDSTTHFEPQDQHQRVALKHLKRLRLKTTKNKNLNSFWLDYCIDRFPSNEFSISDDSYVWGSTWNDRYQIFNWLKNYHAFLKQFVGNATLTGSYDLNEFLLEDKLKYLKITAGWVRFEQQVSFADGS